MKPIKLAALAIASMLPCVVPGLRAAPESIFPNSVTPDAEYYDAPSWELGTIFSSLAPGQITQVRVFSLSDESGAHAVSIWQNSPETLLFSTNWSFGGDGAWITLSIPPLRIEATANYTLSISTTPAGAYPDNSHYFDAPGGDGQYLSYPQGAGVFNATLGSRPTGSYNNSAYLRDIVFMTDSVFPVIGIKGNSLAIPSGDVTPSLVDGTQFGGVKLGSAKSATFTVANPGTSNLVFSGASAVVVAGPQSADFTVTAQPVSPVVPGGSTTFTIQFAPSAPGLRDATLIITNNAQPPYQFAIEGIGMGTGNLIIGNASEGNATGAIDDGTTTGITGNRYLALRNMSVTAIHAKVVGLTGNFECAIYSDASGSNGLAGQFLQGTAPVTNPTNGWQTFALSKPVNVGVGSNYWLVIWSDTIGAQVYGDAGGTAEQDLYAYGQPWPDPITLVGAKSSLTYSIYAQGVPLDDSGPEMYVKGGINAVADGSTNVSTSNGTDFGSAMLYGATRAQTFTIQNVGQGSLSLTGAPVVTVIGPQASDFVMTTQPVGSVASGGSTAFTITFTPSAAGIRTATVVIPHADSPTKAYQFAIQGEGLNDPGADVVGHNGAGADSRPDAAMDITGNRFMAPADLQIANLQAKVVALAGGNFACAVYADNNGFPGSLLRSSAVLATATNGWNAFPLSSPLNVTAGTFYWLVIWTDTMGNALDIDPGGTAYSGSSAYSWATLNGQWPDPIFLNPIGESRLYCIYAEGTEISPAPGAQMSLRGIGKLILYGDTAPSTLDGTDFGSVAAAKGAADHTFTIQNLGADPLQLTGAPPVVITGPQASDFSVTSPPTSPVPPGGSTTFTVRFSPSVSGLRAATVSIASNDIDPDKNPYQFAVRGAGFVVGRESLFPDSEVGSDVDNDGTQYDLGTIFSSAVAGRLTQLRVFSVAGDLGPHTAWIWNSDGSALAGPYTWDFGHVNGWIYLDIPSVAIQAGNQYTVDITTGQGPMHDYANEPAVLANGGGNSLDLSYPASAGVFISANGNPGPPPPESMPNQTWNGSSYLRDIVFVPAGTTASFPDMAVLGNNALIQDGYSSPSNTNNTDFGNVTAGGGNVDLTFIITNAGAAPLNLNSTPVVGITGPQASDFTLVAQPATPIPPGGNSSLTIRFAPVAPGARNALVSIGNDDKNAYYFSITGTGTFAPRISAVTTDMNAGNFTLQWVAQGQQVQVYRATKLTGPFAPIGALQSGNTYTDLGILKTNTQAFYRIGY